MRVYSLVFIIIVFLCVGFSLNKEGFACESCMISRIGKDAGIYAESLDQKWFFEYLFEQKKYDIIDALTAHELHHDGHEIHDKTTEDFHHFILGGKFTPRFTVTLEFPYVIRRSIEVDSHEALGLKQRSEGFGDTTLLGEYLISRREGQIFKAVTGIKFPTGYTGEKNSQGDKFEPELQPGSGSVDYIVGGIYQTTINRLHIIGNVTYVFNTQGAYNFEFGDMLTVSTSMDYVINPRWRLFQIRGGWDFVFQNEKEEQQDGHKNPDSGGTTLLIGPIVSVTARPGTQLFASLLFPAYQDLGGVHQEIDYTWTLGARVNW